MVEILKAVLFGILEGVTEWLPVSSTGHLILLDRSLELQVTEGFYGMFQVVIQLGAVLAVAVLFFRKLCPFPKSGEERSKTWRLWGMVTVAVIPSAILGILLDDWMEEHLHNALTVSAMLILYGLAFLLVERSRVRQPSVRSAEAIDLKRALATGCFQALSLVPGTSRSGATILGAMLLGVERSAAAEFSFFMAVPTMAGAGAVKLTKYFLSGAGLTGLEAAILFTGCSVSFLVSMLVIRGLMDYVRQRSFVPFGIYRIGLGLAVLFLFPFAK